MEMLKYTTRDRIFDYIVAYRSRNGYSPSYREIGQALSLQSVGNIARHIQRLYSDGRLSGRRYSPRAMVPRA